MGLGIDWGISWRDQHWAMLIFYYVEQHLVGNVGHEQGVSAMAVISVAQVGGHCSHNRCHRRKGRLQRKYFKNNSSFYLFRTCPTLSVSPATVGGLTMRRRSLSRTRGRKATRDSGLALPTSLRLATRSPSSSCGILLLYNCKTDEAFVIEQFGALFTQTWPLWAWGPAGANSLLPSLYYTRRQTYICAILNF